MSETGQIPQAKTASVVLPVYNEEAAIREVILDIDGVMRSSAYQYEILVVDDGSKDRTLAILEELHREVPALRVVRHQRNQGEGQARKTGILHAQFAHIVMLDADGTYPCQDIPRVLDLLPAYDMSVGARVREAGTVRWLRTPAKWFLVKLASFIVEQPIPDLNSGLRAFKQAAALKFFGILPNGLSWVSTLTLSFLSNGYSVAFTPIEYYTRKGKSSFHPIHDTLNYFKLINRTIMYFRPLRFFIPLTVSILATGVGRFLYHALMLHKVRESDTMVILTGIIVGSVAVTADLVLKLARINFVKTEPGGPVETAGSTILDANGGIVR